MKRHNLKLYLSIVSLISFTTAMAVRIFDAHIHGNVWLAFDRRSDIGYPIAHILTLIALVAALFAKFGLRKRAS